MTIHHHPETGRAAPMPADLSLAQEDQRNPASVLGRARAVRAPADVSDVLIADIGPSDLFIPEPSEAPPQTDRARMEAAVEWLLAAADRLIRDLDALDAQAEDQEDDTEDFDGQDGFGRSVDEEPDLGAPELDIIRVGDQRDWARGGGHDADDSDLEPSLGAFEDRDTQVSWAFSGNDQDLEEEHDGCEPEEQDEDGDEEDFSGAVDERGSWCGEVPAAERAATDATLRRLQDKLRALGC